MQWRSPSSPVHQVLLLLVADQPGLRGSAGQPAAAHQVRPRRGQRDPEEREGRPRRLQRGVRLRHRLAEVRPADELPEAGHQRYDNRALRARETLNPFSVGGQEMVLRGCHPAATRELSICGQVVKVAGEAGGVEIAHCSLCNADGCNSAPKMAAGAICLAAALIARP